ncbi:MAG TPA: hypothetical protein VKU36_01955 [Candidatus Babeliales bacterium]|nr:hypothetical protein [Candidatus Babeliales bacterium]
MQKIYFFTLSLLSMLTILTPILGMEISSSIKMKTFMVDLYVREKTVNDTDNSLINDKHGCEVLGIEWKPDNKYKTDVADIYNADDTNNKWTWNMTHPTFLPLATIANDARFKGLEYVVFFPNIVPTNFIERLKKEGPITLTNTSFAEPVEITVHLKTIYENGHTTYYDNLHFDPISNEELTSNSSSPSPEELLNQFPPTPKNSPTTFSSNCKKFIIPAAVITLGIIAYIIYSNWLKLPFNQKA